MALVLLLRRIAPREGWWTFLVVVAIATCMPLALVAAGWVPGDDGLVGAVLIGLLLGRWMAQRREWGWDVWLTSGLALGLLVVLSVASRSIPFLPGGGVKSFAFVRRWFDWLAAAASGGSLEAPDVFLLYLALILWIVTLVATWAFYRGERPLLTLGLLIIPAAVSVFYSADGIGWLVVQIGLGVILAASGHLARAQRRWDATGIDYATDLKLGIAAATVPIALFIALASFLGPEFTINNISDWFWETFEDTSSRVDDTMDRLFGGVTPPDEGPPGPGGNSGSSMPQDHLLGGRPDLQEDLAFRVWTDEPPPPPEEEMLGIRDPSYVALRHYWRAAAFDVYTGRGWKVSVEDGRPVTGALPAYQPPWYREVTQQYEFFAPHGETLYVLNAPVTVTSAVDALWYTPPLSSSIEWTVYPQETSLQAGDLARILSSTVAYTIVSRIPEPTASELRSLPDTYPPEIAERYLALPDSVPQRVLDLALEVTVDGATPYDKARLLESYLRLYPYSLDVEQVPEGEDVVDYFLFDVREGYCDYYASAYVVMARAAGIPARLASGYVGGHYDQTSGAYYVVQRNGHSWPEVFFPEWGWIGFEPTGAQSVNIFPEDSGLDFDNLPEPTGPPASVRKVRWRQTLRLILVGVLLLGLAWYALRRGWLRPSPRMSLPLLWARVRRAGGRLGVPPGHAVTPREYVTQLAAEMHRLASGARHRRASWLKLAQDGQEMLDNLAALYAVQVYSGARGRVASEGRLRAMWQDLRRPLRLFRWFGLLRRLGLV